MPRGIYERSEEELNRIKSLSKGRHSNFSCPCGSTSHAWCKQGRPDVSISISKGKTGKPGHSGSDKQREAVLKLNSLKRGKSQSLESNRKRSEALKGISKPHSDAHKAALVLAARDPARRAKLSSSLKCHWKISKYKPVYSNTKLEKILIMLLSDFPTVDTQVRFGRYSVDAYLPEYKLAFEADGHYWHRDKEGQSEKDAFRDAEIFRRWGVIVVRLDEDDLIWLPYGSM